VRILRVRPVCFSMARREVGRLESCCDCIFFAIAYEMMPGRPIMQVSIQVGGIASVDIPLVDSFADRAELPSLLLVEVHNFPL
jgi:hypothetical protein